MDLEAQLIFVYLTVCQFFLQDPSRKKLRKSPNTELNFTDEEVITIYIFGILHGFRNNKQIHQLIYVYWKSWFPNLPKYSTFNHRLNVVMSEFISFSDAFIHNFKTNIKNEENIVVIDSMPIILARGSRSHKAKVAKDTASLGYCASKKLFYWGVKFHLFAEYVKNSLPKPRILNITGANEHDLSAVKDIFEDFENCKIIGDKAYINGEYKQNLAKKNVQLCTPCKLSKFKKSLTDDETIYSKIVSSFRQSIEIFFSWIIEKTGIQNASKVRSDRGLAVHIFGRFAAAMILLILKG